MRLKNSGGGGGGGPEVTPSGLLRAGCSSYFLGVEIGDLVF